MKFTSNIACKFVSILQLRSQKIVVINHDFIYASCDYNTSHLRYNNYNILVQNQITKKIV